MNLAEAVVYQPKDPICGVRPLFLLPSQDSADYFASCEGGLPEAPLIQWAAQFLDFDRGDSFIDVGAHVGTWGITYSMAGATVDAVEANPLVYRLLLAGFVLNGPGKWDTLNFAALHSATDGGEWQFAVPHSDGGGASCIPRVTVGFDSPVDAFRTRGRSLDKVFIANHLHGPRLIKIDVEGAELLTLKGAERLIGAYRPKLIIEIWQDERGQDREETFRYLRDALDYSVVPINGWDEMILAEPRKD